MQDKPAEACRLIREGQLESLRELWRINRVLLHRSEQLAPQQVSQMLDRYNLVIEQLQDLHQLLAAYRYHGVFSSDQLLDYLVDRRMKRAARMAEAVHPLLITVLDRMQSAPPSLRFDRHGRLEGQ